MPFFDYQCEDGHVTEEFFSTITKGEEAEGKPGVCAACGKPTQRVVSSGVAVHFLGNPAGWSKPSPSQRHSYKTRNSWGNSGRPR